MIVSPCQQKNGEGGIRTRGTGVYPYDGLANRCLKPLGHLSKYFNIIPLYNFQKITILPNYNLNYNQFVIYNLGIMFDYVVIVKDISHGKI